MLCKSSHEDKKFILNFIIKHFWSERETKMEYNKIFVMFSLGLVCIL